MFRINIKIAKPIIECISALYIFLHLLFKASNNSSSFFASSYCKKFEGKVYSLSGKDTRFPSLYDTALAKGYNIMHPNCRHEFIPFAEELFSKEQVEKLQKESNHFVDYHKDDRLFRIYNRDQALHRQWVDEKREYDNFKSQLGVNMPYDTIGGFRRARRSKSDEYLYYSKLCKELTKSKEYSIIKTGARVKTQKEQDKHATTFYGLVRKMSTDVKRIAENTGFSQKQIQKIKNYVFIEKHDFLDSVDKRFVPDFAISQSWQRMFEGKDILPHDIVLLKHELLEIDYIRNGKSQEEAHLLASREYNYGKEYDKYVDSTTKKRR